MSHTKEPWSVNFNNTLGHIKSMAKHPRNATPTVARFDTRTPSIDEDEALANAERIVACVNGCEGINPEAVKDLLEACQFIDGMLSEEDIYSHALINKPGQPDRTPLDVVRAAIAKATESEVNDG